MHENEIITAEFISVILSDDFSNMGDCLVMASMIEFNSGDNYMQMGIFLSIITCALVLFGSGDSVVCSCVNKQN